jgi:hypothetical protein
MQIFIATSVITSNPMWISVAWNRLQWQPLVSTLMKFWICKGWIFSWSAERLLASQDGPYSMDCMLFPVRPSLRSCVTGCQWSRPDSWVELMYVAYRPCLCVGGWVKTDFTNRTLPYHFTPRVHIWTATHSVVLQFFSIVCLICILKYVTSRFADLYSILLVESFRSRH